MIEPSDGQCWQLVLWSIWPPFRGQFHHFIVRFTWILSADHVSNFAAGPLDEFTILFHNIPNCPVLMSWRLFCRGSKWMDYDSWRIFLEELTWRKRLNLEYVIEKLESTGKPYIINATINRGWITNTVIRKWWSDIVTFWGITGYVMPSDHYCYDNAKPSTCTN